MPGDDLRHVDWAAYARSDSLNIRLYREEVAPRLDLLIDVANNIDGNTICALGEAAAWPTKFTIERLREEFEAKVSDNYVHAPKNIVHALRDERERAEAPG